MKTKILIGFFLAAVLTGTGAAERPGTAVEKHAYTFLTQGEPNGGLDAYLKGIGAAQGKRHDAIVAAVKAMRAARDVEQTEPGSVAFWEAVDEGLGQKPSREDTTVAEPAAPKPAAPEKKVREEDQARLHELEAQEATLKPLLADYAKAVTGTTEEKKKRTAENKRDEVSFKLTINRAEQHLLQAKYKTIQAAVTAAAKADSKAKEAAATAQQKEAEAQIKHSALVDKMANEDLGALRKYGFSIAAGYGYFGRLQEAAGVAQVKYHFYQRKDLRERALRKLQATASDPTGRDKLKWAKTTAVSGWLGTSFSPFKHRDPVTGTATTDKPLLAGLALGFGEGIEGSSAVHIDGGVALFNAEGFHKNDWYVGASVDAIIFKQIVKAIGEMTSGE